MLQYNLNPSASQSKKHGTRLRLLAGGAKTAQASRPRRTRPASCRRNTTTSSASSSTTCPTRWKKRWHTFSTGGGFGDVKTKCPTRWGRATISVGAAGRGSQSRHSASSAPGGKMLFHLWERRGSSCQAKYEPARRQSPGRFLVTRIGHGAGLGRQLYFRRSQESVRGHLPAPEPAPPPPLLPVVAR
jgi:hypothetical protein